MSHEDRRKYRQLVSGLMAAHKPRDEFERMVIQQLAHANWELRRVQATDSEFWEHLGGSYNRGNAGIAEGLLQEKEVRFRPHFKLRLIAQRQYDKAMNDLYRMLSLRERTAGNQIPLNEPPADMAPKKEKVAVASAPFPVAQTTASAPRRNPVQPVQGRLTG